MEEESLSKRKTQLDAIRAKCREFELASFNNAALREEQERELSPENEQERQVERPLALTPYNHNVHQDVKRFVHQGILDRDSDAFQPAFALFGKTSAIECLEAETWPVHLLVTADFARTVHASENQHLDSFLRSVHWVASGKNRNTIICVVLSPFEAHALLPSMPSMSTQPGRHVESPSDCDEAFSPLVVGQASSGSTVASPRDPHRKLKLSTNVVAETTLDESSTWAGSILSWCWYGEIAVERHRYPVGEGALANYLSGSREVRYM